MTKVLWQDHFKESLSGAREAFAQAMTDSGHPGAEKSLPETAFLAFCLRQHILSQRDYFQWAKEAQQIPVLMDEFFLDHAPASQLFARTQNAYAWNSVCLPIAEWDGLLMVGCLEIPEDFPLETPAVFLLASPEQLAHTWEVYNTAPFAMPDVEAKAEPIVEAKAEPIVEAKAEPIVEAKAEPILEVKAEPTLEAKVEFVAKTEEDPLAKAAAELFSDIPADPKALFDANGELILKEEELAAVGSNPEIVLAAVEENGSPEGLFADAPAKTPVLSDISSPTVDISAHTVKAAVEDPAEALLQSLNQTAASEPIRLDATVIDATAFDKTTIDEVPAETVSFDIKTKTKAVLDPTPATEEPAPALTLQEPAAVKGPRTVQPLGPVPTKQEMADLENSQIHAPPPVVPTANALPKAPVKPSTPTSGSAAYLLEKTKNQMGARFETEAMAAFQKMKPHFKKSMLLAIGDKDRVIKPLIWDQGFVTQTPAKSEFELKTPSFLRIVATTQKPYHGFITPNDFNDTFFENWNQGQIPDHVTLVPFMDGDIMIGMLLGIGEKSSYNRNVLQITEAISKELSTKLLKGAGSVGSVSPAPKSAPPSTAPNRVA